MNIALNRTKYKSSWFKFASKKNIIDDNRTITLNYRSMRILDYLGVWEKLPKPPNPIHTIKVAKNFPKTRNDWLLNWKNEIRPMAYVVYNKNLQNIFTKINKKVDTITIKSVKKQNNNILLEDNSNNKYIPDLTIGCDGSNSIFHKLFNINKFNTTTNQIAIVANLQTEKKTNHTAYQRFLPDGPLALMPISDYECSMVWTLSNHTFKNISKNNNLFNKHINESFGSELGTLSLNSKISNWYLNTFYLPKISYPSLALIGEAAHVIHPLAGMGFNLNISDIKIIQNCLDSAFKLGLNPDHNFVLSEYEKKRSFEIKSFTLSTHLLNKLFSNNFNYLSFLIELGMIGLNKTNFKNIFMKIADGSFFSSNDFYEK